MTIDSHSHSHCLLQDGELFGLPLKWLMRAASVIISSTYTRVQTTKSLHKRKISTESPHKPQQPQDQVRGTKPSRAPSPASPNSEIKSAHSPRWLLEEVCYFGMSQPTFHDSQALSTASLMVSIFAQKKIRFIQ